MAKPSTAISCIEAHKFITKIIPANKAGLYVIGIYDALNAHINMSNCRGISHDFRLPTFLNQNLSTIGAHTILSIHGNANILLNPMIVNDIPDWRNNTGNAVT